jgi:hypothetical protein
MQESAWLNGNRDELLTIFLDQQAADKVWL